MINWPTFYTLICGATILGFICLIVSGILRQAEVAKLEEGRDELRQQVTELQEKVSALEEALRAKVAFQKKIQDICERGGKIGSTR
jgi:outer membrane murein-binding lipoprotein Lpp